MSTTLDPFSGLDHTWVGDLTLTLRSPGGTAVKLFDRPGGVNNSGNNFCQTVLDDAGTSSIQTIAVADAPWTGTFQPAQPLAGFAGEASSGTWTVHTTDAVLSDFGSIRAFSIDVSVRRDVGTSSPRLYAAWAP